MQVKDEKRYQEWRAKNSDDAYSLRCFTYAEDWADMMEKVIAEGKKIFEGEKYETIADKLSHDADTDGITGFMYGVAVSILASCWIHGEELRQWHNLATQMHDEGEKANKKAGSVLNPALLTMKGD